MQKDALAQPGNTDANPTRSASAGHARPLRYDPYAQPGKTRPCSRPKNILVAGFSDKVDQAGLACAALLVEAGQRVVTSLSARSLPPSLAGALADGRLIDLPGLATDAAGIQGAIRALPAPFRSVDAVVAFIHLPARRIALLAPDAPCAEPDPATSTAMLLTATRAALPGLLASERGHVIAVVLSPRPCSDIDLDSHTAALRSELDALGIRFTRIVAGSIECEAGPTSRSGNRPRFNGVQRGVLGATDVAQTIAWALAQPDHVAVCDITVCHAPRAQPVLSPREWEVLEWTACGKTSEEISSILDLSVSAVNFHVKSLLSKLDCCNKTAAVARAALLGMLI